MTEIPTNGKKNRSEKESKGSERSANSIYIIHIACNT